MKIRSRLHATGAALLASSLALAVACSSDEERAASHIARGHEYLAEQRRTEATLEFQSALRFDEGNVEANTRLGLLELEVGNLVNALIHLDRAHQADPTGIDAALNMAALLQAENPERAEELIEQTIEQHPDEVRGYISRSKLALYGGRVLAAVAAARKAMSVAPDDPRADFQLGSSLEAMIRTAQLKGESLDDSVFQSALGSFERYIQKGGEAPWNAQLEQARVMAAWADHNRQASRQFHTALDNAKENGSSRDFRIAAAHASAFASAVRDWKLREHTYQLLVEMDPRDYAAWQELAEARRRQRQDPEHTWKQLIESRPDDPRAHIEYARFMVSQWKLDEALAYLEEKASEGIDPAMLRSAVAGTQIAARRMEDATQTVEQLERDFPGHPRVTLARAQLDIRRGRIRKATTALRALAESNKDPDALVLLAQMELAVGDPEGALAAVDEAIAANPIFAIGVRRMRAQILAGQGDHTAAIRGIDELEGHGQLVPEDRLLRARSRYALGQNGRARNDLVELISGSHRPLPEAVLELSRRESAVPELRSLAKQELEKLVRRAPKDWDALSELARLQNEDGEAKQTLSQLDRAFARNKDEVPPRIRLLRAQTRATLGQEEGTLEDALAAFNGQPRLRGSLELLVALHVRRSEITEALTATESARAANAMTSGRWLLLGRLYRMNGRDAEAVAALEEALETDAENPSLYFHMGMALRAIDRNEEGTRALEKALAINPSFPEAEYARQALQSS